MFRAASQRLSLRQHGWQWPPGSPCAHPNGATLCRAIRPPNATCRALENKTAPAPRLCVVMPPGPSIPPHRQRPALRGAYPSAGGAAAWRSQRTPQRRPHRARSGADHHAQNRMAPIHPPRRHAVAATRYPRRPTSRSASPRDPPDRPGYRLQGTGYRGQGRRPPPNKLPIQNPKSKIQNSQRRPRAAERRPACRRWHTRRTPALHCPTAPAADPQRCRGRPPRPPAPGAARRSSASPAAFGAAHREAGPAALGNQRHQRSRPRGPAPWTTRRRFDRVDERCNGELLPEGRARSKSIMLRSANGRHR
jgi:hypothetical protein